MIDIAVAVPTPRPRAAAAPARVATGDFKDTLDGLSETLAPPAEASRVPPGAKGKEADASPAVTLPGKDAVANGSQRFDPATGLPVEPDIVSVATDAEPVPSMLPAPTGKRQAPAGDGKTLPAADADDDEVAPVWLPVGMVVAAPVSRPLALPKLEVAVTTGIAPAIGPAISIVDDTAAAPTPTPPSPAQAGGQSGNGGDPAIASSTWGPAVAGEAGVATAPTAKDAPVGPVARVIDTAKPDLPERVEAATAAAAQPAPQPILPAGQAFAAAIAAAVQQQRDEREPVETHTPIALATAALERLHAPAVAAPADARQAALDLRQDSGLQGMIDHIEVLRDGANAGDTRIRLVPDALGAVDVSVRRDGDRLHVHFNAENQASARLIADAQPRLAELADARGVKLGQTSVDSGDGQQRQQQPATPIQFTRPATTADPIDTPDDLRVA